MEYRRGTHRYRVTVRIKLLYPWWEGFAHALDMDPAWILGDDLPKFVRRSLAQKMQHPGYMLVFHEYGGMTSASWGFSVDVSVGKVTADETTWYPHPFQHRWMRDIEWAARRTVQRYITRTMKKARS